MISAILGVIIGIGVIAGGASTVIYNVDKIKKNKKS
jgi:hypothetical protein